ncbi:MAG: indolepyruvate ferredoxin oxidoreductase subunit alpha [Kiritimatiellia bacterium]|nr:4Fe-4S binding protein [Lentisphaerota bacterium]
MQKKYQVDRGCTFCATCMYECPAEAISMGTGGAVIDTQKCTGCGICYANCASEAISFVEIKSTVEARPSTK